MSIAHGILGLYLLVMSLFGKLNTASKQLFRE